MEVRLRQEWDADKNGCTFEDGRKKPEKRTWWKCEKGHIWTARMMSRIHKESRCPYCTGHRAVKGVNDVATMYPNLSAEFHPTKNGNIKLEDYKECSGKKVWWICEKGHEWDAVINTRTKRGYKCPICSGQKIVSGINDFKTLYPELARELCSYRNEGIDIESLGGKSHRKLYWICPKGHEYEMAVEKRTGRGAGCPYCSRLYPVVGETDLGTLHPEVGQFWDEEKNGSMQNYKSYTRKMVGWKCSHGHKWQNRICNQVNYNKCPYCSGKFLVIGMNDVATMYPELALEWDLEANGIDASNVKACSGLHAYWKCSRGHRWKANLYNRSKGKGCPYCAGKLPIKGENDLATCYPWLEQEWNYDMNREHPADYLPKANTKVWWRCKNGHVYRSLISERTRGTKCPECGE